MSIFANIPIFRHLQLEIASAIPASNDEKLTQTPDLEVVKLHGWGHHRPPSRDSTPQHQTYNSSRADVLH